MSVLFGAMVLMRIEDVVPKTSAMAVKSLLGCALATPKRSGFSSGRSAATSIALLTRDSGEHESTTAVRGRALA